MQETQAKNAALGKKVKAPLSLKPIKSREASFYRVTCKVELVHFIYSFGQALRII